MSDMHLNFGAQPHERPGDDEAREARHQVLATLLGAYTDGELPPETMSQIDAHLLGCVRCRREVELHTAVRERLQREPVGAASPMLRERVMQVVQVAPAREPAAQAVALPWWRRAGVLAAAGVALAGALTLGLTLRTGAAGDDARGTRTSVAEVSSVPLLATVLDDYRRVTAGDLPGRARDLDAVRAAVPFPVEPLHGASVRLLAAWSTDLQGEPAAVLAYRWQDRLVLQYLVAEPVFFRHPGIRTPVAAGSLVSATSGAQSLLAWAAAESGAILVGDATARELSALRVGDAGR